MSITYPHRRNLSGSGGSGSATASASTPTSNLSGCAHASTDRADSADSHHPRSPSTAPQKSQAIPPGQFSTPPINVAIPTIPFPCLKGLHGNCMRNCRARTELRCRTQQPAAPEHPPTATRSAWTLTWRYHNTPECIKQPRPRHSYGGRGRGRVSGHAPRAHLSFSRRAGCAQRRSATSQRPRPSER